MRFKLDTTTLLSLVLLLILGALPLSAQDQAEQREDSCLTMTLTEQLGHFRKISSTSPAVDPGNRIVAIRRLTLLVDDIDANGERIKRGIPLIEIQLHSAVAVPAVNSYFIVRIGSKEFSPGGRGCANDTHCTMVVMAPQEFERLKDGDLILMSNGVWAKPEELAKLRANGDEPMVVGTKFGLLDRTMIDKFPPIERAAVDR